MNKSKFFPQFFRCNFSANILSREFYVVNERQNPKYVRIEDISMEINKT